MQNPQPLYSLHERVWHWFQAAAMVLLLLTGFALHYPDRFGLFGTMARAVDWHSWIGFALILNAFLGLFYHLTAEKYHHYIPKLDDFTWGAVRQARFYLWGIFRGEPHPYEGDARHKLNPLQKVTYLALLNVLLPFQILTGMLLWGADRWPGGLSKFGGLGVLGPAHTMGSFFFLAFLIGHIYLATTGKTPWSLLRAMITGYEEPPGAAAISHVVAGIAGGEPDAVVNAYLSGTLAITGEVCGADTCTHAGITDTRRDERMADGG